MNLKHLSPARAAGLLGGGVVLFVLAGCLTDDPGRRQGYQGRTTGRMQASVVFEDDYDYYPGYEVYYSRSRHEYVYRDGGTWVRRPQPRGVELNVLLASASVRVDFRDSPEQHHNAVVKSYPRNWKRGDQKHDDRKADKDDRKDDRRRD